MKYAILLALALAGCQTAALPAGTPKEVIIKTAVDEKIATASAAISNYCTLAGVSLTVAPLVVRGEKAGLIVRKLQAAINSYCSGPPVTNTEEALLTIARIYREVMTAAPELKAHMDAEWSHLQRRVEWKSR